MSAHGATPESKAEARRLWEEEGWSGREIGKRLGLHHASVGRWAKTAGWERLNGPKRNHVPTDEELDAMRRRQQLAADAQRINWDMRRSDEANAAGVTASRFRALALQRAESGEDLGAQRLALAYEKFIGTAQLLSGGPASALGVVVAADEAESDPSAVAERIARRRLALVPGDTSGTG